MGSFFISHRPGSCSVFLRVGRVCPLETSLIGVVVIDPENVNGFGTAVGPGLHGCQSCLGCREVTSECTVIGNVCKCTMVNKKKLKTKNYLYEN